MQVLFLTKNNGYYLKDYEKQKHAFLFCGRKSAKKLQYLNEILSKIEFLKDFETIVAVLKKFEK